MKTLTVSIAAYNVEKYLEKTLKSLICKKNLDDIEVLIVDDGSTDGTKNIAYDYCNRYPNVFKYIGKQNGGHGSTINTGIREATGKYFKVLDGDDWFNTKYLDNFVDILKKEDSDIVDTSCIRSGEDKEVYYKKKQFINGKKYNLDDNIRRQRKDNLVGILTMAVKSSILKGNNLRVTEKCFYEDMEYSVKVLINSNTYVYYDIPIYMYRVGTGGQSINKKNMLKNVQMQNTISKNVASLYDDFRKNSSGNTLQSELIEDDVIQTIAANYRTYLMMDDANEAKNNIISFDKMLMNNYQYTYKMLDKDLFIKAVRAFNYHFVKSVQKAYRRYIQRA